MGSTTDSKYSFTSPQRQLFSFPPDVISWMLNNPSSHIGLMKLYQTCKYFYGKRPILIADYVDVDILEKTQDPTAQHELAICKPPYYNKKDVITHLRVPIWLTDKIFVTNFDNHFQQLPSFFRYSIQDLSLENCDFKYEHFLMFVAEKNVRSFDAYDSYVYHPNGSKATIDEILIHLPNIQSFCYDIDEKCSTEMLKKLIDMKFKHKFKRFQSIFFDLHPSFDMNLYCDFVMKNSNANTVVYMEFEDGVKEKLELALRKLNPKWKTEAQRGFKRFFHKINPKWEEEIIC